jgi:hypothetical protein
VLPAGGDSSLSITGGGLIPGFRTADGGSMVDGASGSSSYDTAASSGSGGDELAGSLGGGSAAGGSGEQVGGITGAGSVAQAAGQPFTVEVDWAAASSKMRSLYGGLLGAAIVMAAAVLVIGRRLVLRIRG